MALTTQPKRIQLSRRKGWRKPKGAIVVARPSRWGNPFPVDVEPFTREDAVRMYREVVTTGVATLVTNPGTRWEKRERFIGTRAKRVRGHLRLVSPPTLAQIREQLAGHDLACWCPLDQPCHADVLLELANSPAS